MESREEIERCGGEALAIACDVKSLESLESTVQHVVSTFGSLNVLVNNAQEVPNGKLLDVTDDKFEAGWPAGNQATDETLLPAFERRRQHCQFSQLGW